MERMQENEIIRFLKENVEPTEDVSYGTGYRASVYLVDGTFLPCVIFRGSRLIVELAIRRFGEERTGKSIFYRPSNHGYYNIVKTFVAKGNCINDYDISKVEISNYAFPMSILRQIQGETRMGWTGFVVKMKDEKCYSFGTAFLMEFFNMPVGYSVDDINAIINHSYVSKSGEIRSYHSKADKPADKCGFIFRERPYFECYLDNL